MQYVGMLTQIRRNNIKSMVLLVMFPAIIFGMVWLFLALVTYFGNPVYGPGGTVTYELDAPTVNRYFLVTVPWVVAGVGLWFFIAYLSNAAMVRNATGARPLTRKENPRIYNIVENLCMACNMDMPQINVVEDAQLNAFASGIDAKSYTVTLTTGIIDRLDDDELSGVVAHELTHIRNRDTRLLIVSIVFVGIISTVMSLVVQMTYNMMLFGAAGSGRRNNKEGNGLGVIVVLVIGVVCCAIAYVFMLMTRFAISRKREYMADAGGAELCGNPLALASALRKISGDPGLTGVNRSDIAQLYIVHPQGIASGMMGFFNSLFSTHPDTRKRIEILEQF